MLEQHLRVAGDRHQRVVEVVGEPARHLADRVEALLLDDVPLRTVQLDGHRGLLGDAVGQAQVVHREGVRVAHPGDGEDAQELVADLDRLDQERCLGQELERGLVEARVRLAVARVQRGAQALHEVEQRVVRGEGQARERLAQLTRHVVARERDEAVTAARHAPRHAGVGAENTHHFSSRPADGLGEIGGRPDGLADREQRLGLLQALLDLVVEPSLLERHRGLGRERGGEADLLVGEHVERLEMIQDQHARGPALVNERDHQCGLGLEEPHPALWYPRVAARVGDDHRLLPPHRLPEERGHLLERERAEGLGAVRAAGRARAVGELRAHRNHELPRLVAQEDRAAVDAARARRAVRDDLEQRLLLDRRADGLGHLEHPVGLLGALLHCLEGIAELLGGALQLLGALHRAMRGRAGLGHCAPVTAPGGGQEDQAEDPPGAERDVPGEHAPALVGLVHAQGRLGELDHPDHARGARAVHGHEEVGDVGRDEALRLRVRRGHRREPDRHAAADGVAQLVAVGALADEPGLDRPYHRALRVPDLDVDDAGQLADEARALLGPALGAARVLAREQLGQPAPVHRALGDRGGFGPLRLGDRHLEEPRQPDPEGAGEGHDPDQPHHEGPGEPAQGQPSHEGLPLRSSAARLARSSGTRSPATGRAK